MFAGKTTWEMFQIGGFTMYILLFLSFISVTVFLERITYYRKRSRIRRREFMTSIAGAIKKGDIKTAMDVCRETLSPFSRVVYAGLALYGCSGQEIANAMEREITIETAKLERFTSIIATIGNTAVYIGLFGTVLGIIRAFNDIADAGTGGMTIVIGGVAEALVCTATGLFVAIPAVVAFNYVTRRIEHFTRDMELSASELIDMIGRE